MYGSRSVRIYVDEMETVSERGILEDGAKPGVPRADWTAPARTTRMANATVRGEAIGGEDDANPVEL